MSDATNGDTGTDLGLEGYADYVEIGQGGFSVVYRAHQAQFGSTVAIKVITGVIDERSQQRFERECRTMGALRGHPNIVTVFDAGSLPDGRAYLVMEYLAGGSLADRLAEGPLDWEEAVSIGAKVAGALEAAHGAGVLHRDIKPENIFLSSYGEPKLGDFGIARLEGGPATRSGMFTASIAHAPPEIIDGKAPTEAADVYSLASTLYALLNGKPAFAVDTDESIVPMLARIATQALPDLRQRGVPDEVCAVVEQGMAKDPAERIATAAELGRRLTEAAAAARTHPGPPTVPPPPVETTRESVPPAPTPPPPEPGPPIPPPPAPPPPTPPPTTPPPTTPPPSKSRTPLVVGAVAGLVVLLVVVGVVIAVTSGGDEKGSPATTVTVDGGGGSEKRDTSIGLQPGDCFDFPGLQDALDGTLTPEQEAEGITVVDCADPHDLEVFHTGAFFDGPDVPFPGDDQLETEANEFCTDMFAEYVGTPFESSELEFIFEYPESPEWDDGERGYACSVYESGFTKLTGSVEGSGR